MNVLQLRSGAHPAPLCAVGRIDVPASVLAHRFYAEAKANALLRDREGVDERVIGTKNLQQVELYGWGSNVGRHVDKTGYVYLLPLTASPTSKVHCAGQHWLRVEPGRVIRLWDHAVHWTTDSGPCVCAFVGAYQEPDDEAALALLRSGVDALARGDYYGAPRVRGGFRVMMDDECLVATDDMSDAQTALHADALAQGRFVIPCSRCERPAIRLDRHWPYHWESNRCRHHLDVSAPPAAESPDDASVEALLSMPLDLLESA